MERWEIQYMYDNGADNRADINAALADGWEPFAATWVKNEGGINDSAVRVYLRRKTS